MRQLSNFKIEACDKESSEIIVKGINAYNFSKVPPLSANWTPFDFILKNNEGEEIGGILGGIDCYLALEINILWVKEEYRNKGYGSKLLRHIEKLAIKNGATISILDTFDFQAKEFYIKNGYKVFGEIKEYLKNHTRIYLSKNLKDR